MFILTPLTIAGLYRLHMQKGTNLRQRIRYASDSAKMVTANIVTSIFGLVRGIFVAGVLGPANYGIWNLLNVIISYMPYTHFGLLDGMTKKIPRLKAENKIEHSTLIRDNSFSVVIASTLIVPIGMIAISLFFRRFFLADFVHGFRILSGFSALFYLYIFITAYIRVEERFGLLSIVTGAVAVLTLLFMVVFVKLIANSLYAVITGMVVTYLVLDIFLFAFIKYDFKFRIDFPILKEILSLGFPIVLINLGYVLFISVDRWIIASLLGRADLGHYGFAFTICNFLLILPMSISFTLYTKMLHRYGETKDTRSSEKLVYFPALTISYMMSVVCVLVVIALPLFIRLLLPDYESGIDTVTILVLAGYFLSNVPLFANFLISIDKQMRLFFLQIVTIVINLTLNITLIKLGYGINAVAFGTGFGYLCYATMVAFFALHNFTHKLKDILLRLIELYLPFFVTLAIYLLFRYIIKWGYVRELPFCLILLI